MVALHNSEAFSRVAPSFRARFQPARDRRVAVVLNANARAVDQKTLEWVSRVVPQEDLFLSRTLSEGEDIARTLVDRQYDAVFWGGGDGTFAVGLRHVLAAATERGQKLPDMGVLRLGTGNAMADAVGAGAANEKGLTEDLRRARKNESRRQMPLLDLEGRPVLFCGFGLDAQILQDHHALVDGLKKVGLDRQLRNAGLRYFMSVAGRSIPRFVATDRPEVVAVNRGSTAIRVDADGRMIGSPIPTGRVLWRGPVTLASCGTIPFYGLGMRIFPHADREPGRFQLRLSDLGAAEALAHLPKIWTGRVNHPRIADFLVDEVELVLSRPSPMQASGDVVGIRERAVIRHWPHPVAVV
jgi:diacylglycerol kinase family enzyme